MTEPENSGDRFVHADDGALLRRFLSAKGEPRESAFAELVRRHGGLVFGLCRRKLGDASLAEDAMQAVFLILARKSGRLKKEGSLAGWLYRTADLVTRSMKRDRRTRTRHEEAARMSSPESAAPEAQADSEALASLRGRLDEALLQLGSSEREAVLAHYLEGLSQQQAAERQGVSYPAYRQRLSRALERLRGYFGAQGTVLSVSALGAALLSIGQADAAAGAGLHAVCTNCVVGKAAASAAVQAIVKGVLKNMFQKTLLLISGIAALALLGVASALLAADAKPATSAQTVAQPKPAETPKAAVAGDVLAASHVVLDQVKGIGTPVFSADGRWLAVRENGNKLALIEIATALKDPKAQPARYDLAAPVKAGAWGDNALGQAAAFSADGMRMLFAGKDGLMSLKLPPKAPPEPLTGAKDEKLGNEYLPAFNGGILKVIKIEGQADIREETFPLFKVLKAAQPQKGPDEGHAAEVQLVTYRFSVQGDEPRMNGPKVRAGSLKWAPGGNDVLATLEDGSAAVINLFSAKVTKTLDIQGFEKTVGKRLEAAEVLAMTPDGKVVVEGVRQYPSEMRGMQGTFVPAGDEAPERGRNPGSAEPGPGMPRYIYLYDGANHSKIWMASTARTLDTLFVESSAKADKYLYFQVANDGGAGEGVPHAWLGQLDAAGKRTEKDLGNPFAKTVDAPQFDLLDLAPDASKALVLMHANRIKRVPRKLDEAMKKKLEEDLKSQKITAAHRDGQDAMMEMLAGMLLFRKYERAGGREDGANVVLTFSTWQLWEIDAAHQAMKAVTPEFGEAIGELENIVGLPGAPGGRWEGVKSAYNAQAGLLAMNLQGMRMAAGPGDFWEPRGLVLIKAGK
ncbi:MAG: sigma-70 family RNA polymerase sigma factor [Planctomycetes bacterium]|nr:sigma-70 family RNA polymerase sigma factor [Planctomycetota bacterium]